MAPGELTKVISTLVCDDENLLVGIGSKDDASVYKINDARAIVQTVDYITPVVDDPYVYGQIAAANSLSDIFAMGADVITALNIVGFDSNNHNEEVLAEIIQGGLNKVKECGGIIVGGHTIEAPEMTYGLSVCGLIDPKKIYRNNTPRIGDLLVITKPIGFGVLTTAIKADMLDELMVQKIADILTQLNYKASLVMREFDVSACTDITGFGLGGHAHEMSSNGVTLKFNFNEIPILDKAIELANLGIIPAGTYNNKAYISPHVKSSKELRNEIFFYDAQTSGGLLIAVKQSDANNLLKSLKNEGYEYSCIVGEVEKYSEASLVII